MQLHQLKTSQILSAISNRPNCYMFGPAPSPWAILESRFQRAWAVSTSGFLHLLFGPRSAPPWRPCGIFNDVPWLARGDCEARSSRTSGARRIWPRVSAANPGLSRTRMRALKGRTKRRSIRIVKLLVRPCRARVAGNCEPRVRVAHPAACSIYPKRPPCFAPSAVSA